MGGGRGVLYRLTPVCVGHAGLHEYIWGRDPRAVWRVGSSRSERGLQGCEAPWYLADFVVIPNRPEAVMIWKVYARYGSREEEFAAECYANGVIAVGWGHTGDLSPLDTREKVATAYRRSRSRRKEKAAKVAQNVGTLLAFAHEIRRGDAVICPDWRTGRVYVGRISGDYFFGEKPIGRCPFEHRRPVRWWYPTRTLDEITRLLRRPLGGYQAVSRIGDSGESKLFVGLRPKGRQPEPVPPGRKQPRAPDPVYGWQVEQRAMQWLRDQDLEPRDVSAACRGWDIECGARKYEVKGRKDSSTEILLTPNEYKQAKHYGSSYWVLVFTSSPERLDECEPQEIPDPVHSQSWRKVTRPVYVLQEG